MIVSAIVLLTSCNLKFDIYVNNVAFTSSAKTMFVGETATLEVNIYPADATNKVLHFSTSDMGVAAVTQEGVVTAVGAGTAVITVLADDGGFKDNCTITVKPILVPVTGIKWTLWDSPKGAMQLKKGDTATLGVTLLPDNASDIRVFWTSANSDIASVDDKGHVTAVAVGATTVIASTVDGGFTATCEVTVSENVAGVTLSETSIALKETEQKLLFATVAPEDASNKTVVWTSSDEEVASVAFGVVLARKAGHCVVTAATADGNYSASCEVDVTCPVHGVDLNEHSAVIKEGESLALVAAVYPERASNKTVAWSSSDAGIAAVDNNGVVSALKVGKAVITVTADDNASIVATCEINVISPVSAIAIRPEKLDMYKGDDMTLSVEFTPADASNTEVNWRSADSSVATVSAYGVVHGVSAGSADIYAISKDGGNMAVCHVNVYDHVSGVELYSEGKRVGEGEQLKAYVNSQVAIDVVLQPQATILNKNVIWTSSDNAVLARFEGDSYFTARSAGVAVLTATAEDGGSKASCTVRVGEHVTSVEVSPASITENFFVGDSKVLSAKVLPDASLDKTVKWSSEDESKVSVTDNGDGTARITAKAKGSVYVYAVSVDGAVAGKCQVLISSRIDGVDIYNQNNELMTGKTVVVPVGAGETLHTVVTPDDVPDKSVKWSSSNTDAAVVSDSGVVSAKGAGVAVITATTNLGGEKASVTYDVRPNAASIRLSKTTASLTKGSKLSLTATVLPENAFDKNVTWTSSNETVAKVSDKGEITAIKSGNVQITVTSVAVPSVKAVCAVSVNTPVTGISLSPLAKTLVVGDTFNLEAHILPADADNQNVKWVSSAPEVVSVSNQGAVRALAAGAATVTVSSEENPSVKKSCTIKVEDKAVLVTSVSLDKPSLKLDINGTAQLTATVLPNDATNKTVAWTSSNSDIVKVSAAGLVTAVKPGNAVVTATSTDGSNKSAQCAVTVNEPYVPVDIVRLDRSSASLGTGQTLQLTATVLPANATDKSVSWESSNTAIATVSQAGLVTGKAKGTATITAKSTADPKVYASCTVTVTEYVEVTSVTLYCNGAPATNMTIHPGDVVEFEAVVGPENATNKEVEWIRNQTQCATAAFNGNRCTVTAVGYASGQLNLKAKSLDNGKGSQQLIITVTPISLTSLGLNLTKTSAKVGDKIQLVPIYTPENVSKKSVTFKSSDASVASVDSSTGLVSCLKAGETTITATWTDGSTTKTATCTIKVFDPNVGEGGAEHIGFDPWN